MKKLIAFVLFSLATWAFAQPLRIQIPFAPGYYGDTHARSLADYLGKHGIEATVINSTTGGGNLALDTVANDHNSRIITQGGAGFLSFYINTRNPYGGAMVSYIYPVGLNQWVVYARPGLKFTGPSSFKQASYASSGVGSSTHLFFAKIDADLSANMVHLPYKGSSAAAIDVAAGRVDFMVDTAQASTKLAAMGIQPVFLLSKQRNELYLDIPTAVQVGVKSLLDMYDYSTLYYVVNANFDPVLRDRLVSLMHQHNQQYPNKDFELKFGVRNPGRLTATDVDAKLKGHAQHIIELQKKFITP